MPHPCGKDFHSSFHLASKVVIRVAQELSGRTNSSWSAERWINTVSRTGSEELGGSTPLTLPPSARRDDEPIDFHHFVLEVPLIEAHPPNRFIDSAQLADCEFLAAEIGGDGRVLQGVPRLLECIAQDFVMVELQDVPVIEYIRHNCLLGRRGVGTADGFGEVGHDRPVSDGDDPHSRVAIWVSVGTQLLEMVGGVQAGFFNEFTNGGFSEVLFGTDEATRQCEFSLVGLFASLDESDFEGSVFDREHHDVDGHRKWWEGLGVIVSLHLSRHQSTNICSLDKNQDKIIVNYT